MGIRLDNAKKLYMEGIRDGNYVAAINRYVGERYTQHSTPVRDGKEGFIEFFAEFVKRSPERDIQIVRGFEDGQYVFLHALQNLNGGESRWVTADIFDTDAEGKLIEHWDIIEEFTDETVSGHTQIDGPTEPTDLDRTEQNKSLVLDFITDVLKNGDLEKLPQYISGDTFIQRRRSRRPRRLRRIACRTGPLDGLRRDPQGRGLRQFRGGTVEDDPGGS